MRLDIERHSLRITPETPQDEAWIEEVLGLKQGGDTVPLRRVDGFGIGALAYLDAEAPEPGLDGNPR